MCHEGMSSHWRRKHNSIKCVLVAWGREEAKSSSLVMQIWWHLTTDILMPENCSQAVLFLFVYIYIYRKKKTAQSEFQGKAIFWCNTIWCIYFSAFMCSNMCNKYMRETTKNLQAACLTVYFILKLNKYRNTKRKNIVSGHFFSRN